MNLKIDDRGRLINPAVQINTSVYAMMREGIELDDTGEPVFDEKDSEGGDAFSYFRELDPLMYKTYSPRDVAAAREVESQHDLSARAAANINAVKP